MNREIPLLLLISVSSNVLITTVWTSDYVFFNRDNVTDNTIDMIKKTGFFSTLTVTLLFSFVIIPFFIIAYIITAFYGINKYKKRYMYLNEYNSLVEEELRHQIGSPEKTSVIKMYLSMKIFVFLLMLLVGFGQLFPSLSQKLDIVKLITYSVYLFLFIMEGIYTIIRWCDVYR